MKLLTTPALSATTLCILGRKSLFRWDADGVDKEFSPYPSPHLFLAAHPRRRRRQAAAERHGVAIQSLDLPSATASVPGGVWSGTNAAVGRATGHRPVVQSGPERHGDQHPRLVGHILLGEVLGDFLDRAV